MGISSSEQSRMDFLFYFQYQTCLPETMSKTHAPVALLFHSVCSSIMSPICFLDTVLKSMINKQLGIHSVCQMEYNHMHKHLFISRMLRTCTSCTSHFTTEH